MRKKNNELKDKTIMDRLSLYFCLLNLHKDRLNRPVYYLYELQFVEYSFMEYLKCLEKYNNYRDEVDRRGLTYKIHYNSNQIYWKKPGGYYWELA